MILGQLIALGQLTDLGIDFALVHGLTPVTQFHMSFSLPRGNFERRISRCTTPGNLPCRGNFSPCEQNAKVASGQGPVHMIPGKLIAPGQLSDLWVKFASVHGLTPVIVHMSFSLPRGNFERLVTRCNIG